MQPYARSQGVQFYEDRWAVRVRLGKYMDQPTALEHLVERANTCAPTS